MEGLYKQILQANKNKGLTPVETLLKDSGLLVAVKNKLQYEGYNITKLNDKGVAVLFFSLVDIVCVVKDNAFYLATLSEAQLSTLYHQNRLIKRDDEPNFSVKSSPIILGNTKELINQYLLQGKFHFVKLNMVESCKSYSFLASVGTMNPYPSCDIEQVYCLADMANWHNELYNVLLTGCYKLKTTYGFELCQNYLSKTKSACTSGHLLTKNLDNMLVHIPLWQILDYEHYAQDELEMKLLNGVVSYDNKNLTLNRDILEKYYGRQLYTTFESIGVRRRYCLEELLSIGNKYSVAYYVNKYNLQIYDCHDLHQLELRLKELIELDSKQDDNRIIHARVLFSADAIKSGHRSFYHSINLASTAPHAIEVVENVGTVMPKRYFYYAISKSVGYNYVEIKATSDNLAMKYGETEFERQFGKVEVFCTLVCETTLVKGKPVFKLGVTEQRELCQSVMYGYKHNYDGYAKKVRALCKKNGVTEEVTDDCIQYLFANEIARKCKYTAKLNTAIVSDKLVDFLIIMTNADLIDKKLNLAYEELAWGRAQKEWVKINSAHPIYNGYYIDDTPDGRFIKTEFGRYKIGADGLNKRVELYFKGKHICNKIVK